MRPRYEVADVIRKHLPQMDSHKLTVHHKKTLSALSQCRTAALGAHLDICDQCREIQVSYNSCRNRHCPKCQGLNKEMWTIQQEDMLLNIAYFHVVFTLPHELNEFCLHHPSEMYNLLFQSAWHSIKTLSGDPKWMGAQTAATMVLHTWSQTLSLHPHIHCIIPNGGLTKEGKWQMPKKGKSNFLFPIKAIQKLYKGFFMEHFRALITKGSIKWPTQLRYSSFIRDLYKKDWVVYTKKPFSGAIHVVQYLARYSHRVAITNHRIKVIDEDKVTFEYKDYKDKAKKKLMSLNGTEFLRRFCLHILPLRFRKVRQYGFLSNAAKGKKLHIARKALGLKAKELLTRSQRKQLAIKRVFGKDALRCPCCKMGVLVPLYSSISNKAPPQNFKIHPQMLPLIQ